MQAVLNHDKAFGLHRREWPPIRVDIVIEEYSSLVFPVFYLFFAMIFVLNKVVIFNKIGNSIIVPASDLLPNTTHEFKFSVATNIQRGSLLLSMQYICLFAFRTNRVYSPVGAG